MRVWLSVILTLLGVFFMYRNRFRILSYMISIGFLRRFITVLAMNIPEIKDKWMDRMFSRSA